MDNLRGDVMQIGLCSCGRDAGYLIAVARIDRDITPAPLWIRCCGRCLEDRSVGELVMEARLRQAIRANGVQ